MFFKLNTYAYLILGDNGSSIYDLLNGKIHSVPKDVSEELWKLDSGKLELENAIHKSYYEKLIQQNLGRVYETNANVEKIRLGLPKFIDNIASRKFRINNLYLQIENECNLSCSFCYSDNRNFKMTGCRKYRVESDLDLEIYKKAILEAYDLGCRTLHLLGGEPLFNVDIIIDLTKYAKTIGYTSICLYTNGLLVTESIINKLGTSVIFIIQLMTENYSKISREIKSTLHQLTEKKCAYYINICVSKDNFNDDKMILNDINMYKPLGVVKTFVHRDLENDKYKEYVTSEIFNTNCNIDEGQFHANINHHPCLNGKVVVFRDGKVGACPMLYESAELSLYESDLCNIISSNYIKSMWDRPISTHSSCVACSLRLYCPDCIAITREADKQHVRAFCRKQLEGGM